MTVNKSLIAVLLMTAGLGACGGGGSVSFNTSPPPAGPSEGLWQGSTSSARTITTFVLDNGVFWILYSGSGPNPGTGIAGLIQGSGTSINGSFSSADAKDVNLEGQGIGAATVSASYVAKTSFNGTIFYPNLNQTVSFASNYNIAYEQAPSVATLAGSYTGIASTAGATDAAIVRIDASGNLNGIGTSGCQFAGTASPHARGNLYDLSITFKGGACSNGSNTLTGIAYYDAAARRLYNVALNSERSSGFIYVGLKN
ncbi:hypothetical protein ACFOFO_04390 [Undibacterium arcticum]|uniref:Lipoprotein n=1 Tax=Undibacterium arcticum TaxID=1762892 RepID=A0ABV7EX38_9BURK